MFCVAFALGCPAIGWSGDAEPALRLPVTESVAEAWPTLQQLVRMSLLIVHCRTEKVDIQGQERVLFKVLDAWKGEYSPQAFVVPPPTGYIDTDLGAGGNREPGREVVLFFARHNQPKAGISRHDMMLAVRDGLVSYPGDVGDRLTPSRRFALTDFKREVKQLVDDRIEDIPQPEPAPVRRQSHDFSGTWRVLLPAGFEHQVTLTSAGENRFRVEPRSLNMSGVYEVRGDRLVLVEPQEERLRGFEWSIRSPFLMTLTSEATNTGATYRDAVLFRSNDIRGREPAGAARRPNHPNPPGTRPAGSELPQLSPRS
jgi:hypothetical protein